MLKNITWLQYFTAVLLILIPYYGYLFLRYYKSKKIGFKTEKKASFHEEDFPEDFENPEEQDFDAIPEDLFTQAQELIEKLKALILRASNEGIEKTELLVNIKSELDDYPSLNIDAFRPAINELVIAECDRNSSVTLSEREVDGLWE